MRLSECLLGKYNLIAILQPSLCMLAIYFPFPTVVVGIFLYSLFISISNGETITQFEVLTFSHTGKAARVTIPNGNVTTSPSLPVAVHPEHCPVCPDSENAVVISDVAVLVTGNQSFLLDLGDTNGQWKTYTPPDCSGISSVDVLEGLDGSSKLYFLSCAEELILYEIDLKNMPGRSSEPKLSPISYDGIAATPPVFFRSTNEYFVAYTDSMGRLYANRIEADNPHPINDIQCGFIKNIIHLSDLIILECSEDDTSVNVTEVVVTRYGTEGHYRLNAQYPFGKSSIFEAESSVADQVLLSFTGGHPGCATHFTVVELLENGGRNGSLCLPNQLHSYSYGYYGLDPVLVYALVEGGIFWVNMTVLLNGITTTGISIAGSDKACTSTECGGIIYVSAGSVIAAAKEQRIILLSLGNATPVEADVGFTVQGLNFISSAVLVVPSPSTDLPSDLLPSSTLPTQSPTESPTKKTDQKKDISVPIGVSIAVILIITILVIVAAVFCYKRMKAKHQSKSQMYVMKLCYNVHIKQLLGLGQCLYSVTRY